MSRHSRDDNPDGTPAEELIPPRPFTVVIGQSDLGELAGPSTLPEAVVRMSHRPELPDTAPMRAQPRGSTRRELGDF